MDTEPDECFNGDERLNPLLDCSRRRLACVLLAVFFSISATLLKLKQSSWWVLLLAAASSCLDAAAVDAANLPCRRSLHVPMAFLPSYPTILHLPHHHHPPLPHYPTLTSFLPSFTQFIGTSHQPRHSNYCMSADECRITKPGCKLLHRARIRFPIPLLFFPCFLPFLFLFAPSPFPPLPPFPVHICMTPSGVHFSSVWLGSIWVPIRRHRIIPPARCLPL